MVQLPVNAVHLRSSYTSTTTYLYFSPWPGAVKQIILTGVPLFVLFGLFCVVVVVSVIVVVVGVVVMVGVVEVINVVVVMGDISAFLSWGSEEINIRSFLYSSLMLQSETNNDEARGDEQQRNEGSDDNKESEGDRVNVSISCFSNKGSPMFFHVPPLISLFSKSIAIAFPSLILLRADDAPLFEPVDARLLVLGSSLVCGLSILVKV